MKYKEILLSIKRNLSLLLRINFPKFFVNKQYKENFGRNINWNHPKEMNEKIRWTQFNTDTSKWTELADKFQVREYLCQKGYKDLLIPLYGVWENVNDIKLEELPERFVLKTNHGSGSVYIINNKNEINFNSIKEGLTKEISRKYGYGAIEPHYYKIKPKILAEKLLEQDVDYSKSIIDYKFYCVNGEPLYCGVFYNREKRGVNVKLYDMDWMDNSDLLGEKVNRGNVSVPKPKNLDKMISFCRDLGKEFPFVRIDFYEINGKLYFGEFTFTPAGCSGGSLSHELCYKIGSKIKLHG